MTSDADMMKSIPLANGRADAVLSALGGASRDPALLAATALVPALWDPHGASGLC